MIPTATNSRMIPPVCCMCRRVGDRVWVRGAWDNALWAASAPWKSCRWYPACTRPRKLGSGSRVYAGDSAGNSDGAAGDQYDLRSICIRSDCRWAANGRVDFWRESARTTALPCIVSPMHGRAIHGVVVGQVLPYLYFPTRYAGTKTKTGCTYSSSSKFSLRAPPPWRDLPVTHTGFSGPPPFRLLY